MRMNVNWPNASSTILNAMPTNGLVGSGSSGNSCVGSSYCLALTGAIERRGQIAHDRVQQRLHALVLIGRAHEDRRQILALHGFA